MSLIFIDSFDHYSTSELTYKYATLGNASIQTGSRNNTQKLHFGSPGTATIALNGNYQTIVVGFAFKSDQVATTSYLLQLYDGGSEQVRVVVTAGGAITIGRASTTYDTSTNTLSEDTWYYCEVKATIDNTVGSIELRINGVTWASASGVDTQSSANPQVNLVSLRNTAGGRDFDDVYVLNDSGSRNNDFLGDVTVEVIYPNADTAQADWTPLTGVDNYAMVDETLIDNDTTYNYTSTSGDIDMFSFSNLTTASGEIHGIQTVLGARKDDAAVRYLKAKVGTAGEGSLQAISTSYQFYRDIFEENPDTVSGWTFSDINGDEFGVEHLA